MGAWAGRVTVRTACGPQRCQAGVCPLPLQNADTAKQLTVTQQSQEEVARVKEQLAFQMEQVKRESEMKVCASVRRRPPPPSPPRPLPPAPRDLLSCPSWRSRVTCWRS